jgi:hypothetical protein
MKTVPRMEKSTELDVPFSEDYTLQATLGNQVK